MSSAADPWFPESYADARQGFVDACHEAGLEVESLPHPLTGSGSEPLALDAAHGGAADSPKLLILSSGLHGLEGRLGCGLQVDALRRSLVERAVGQGWRLLLLHGLNPYGMAHDRRCDEQNIDPNRNFLLPGESFDGADPVLLELDPWLHPAHRPAWHDRLGFMLGAARAISKWGLPRLKQALAGGQYELPHGLFYGGKAPCWTQQTLAEHLPRWTGASRQVVHLDFHSGLGRWGACHLLVDYPLDPRQREWLDARYPDGQWETSHQEGVAYQARGVLARWCNHRFQQDRLYIHACVEFGTYPATRVLWSLRRELQAWRQGARDTAVRTDVRRMFLPVRPAWRRLAAETSWQRITAALS